MKNIKSTLRLAVLSSLLLVALPINATEIKGPNDQNKVRVEEICIAGKAYVIAISGEGYKYLKDVSITQVWEPNDHRHLPPQPKTCSD